MPGLATGAPLSESLDLVSSSLDLNQPISRLGSRSRQLGGDLVDLLPLEETNNRPGARPQHTSSFAYRLTLTSRLHGGQNTNYLYVRRKILFFGHSFPSDEDSRYLGISQIAGISEYLGISQIAGISEYLGISQIAGISEYLGISQIAGISEYLGISQIADISEYLGISQIAGISEYLGISQIADISEYLR
ncbi:hypothetical protein RRG08_022837 [Elysia crispata]|uniref:Uncharacterized protein n=1 Tax=Elysia crispata TaxID=231223 RepID=A0AAE0Z098_9GAST|nr:hypothetical protein RRG08_022837 [Elysia crispata]